MSYFYSLAATRLDGQPQPFADFRGKAVLVVNVASHCGFTQQYRGLESLYQEFAGRGLVVLGFPCAQFMGQEFRDNQKIQQFCSLDMKVTFPLFERIDVNGLNTHPVYRWLKSQAAGWLGVRRIPWNFTKFLVDPAGKVVGRYGPTKTPTSLRPIIQKLCPAVVPA